MKKILSTLCMTLVAAVMLAQAPSITFDETKYDFGEIFKEDGNVTHDFYFTNTGMDAVTIVNVKVGCGCTTSKKTEGPIEPGQRGFVSATYRASSQRAPQHFNKYLDVTFESANSKETAKIHLTFHGDLKERAAKAETSFPIALGPIGVKTRELDFGLVRKGEPRTGGFEFANISQEEHTVSLFLGAAESFVSQEIAIPTIKPNEMGKFTFSIDTKGDKTWGPHDIPVYVVIDGKKELTDEYRLTLRANIIQDFSQMSVEDKQNAPIIEVGAKEELGTVAAGKTLKHSLQIKNTGVNPLDILRVYADNEDMVVKAPKAIKSGKKATISIEINTKNMQPGLYTRELTIISNDYRNSVKRVIVSWKVE